MHSGSALTGTLIQRAAALVGLTFLTVGIAGFIPGITTNLYDGLHFAGHDGDAELLGIFDVSVLHNIVHLLFDEASDANFVPLDTADDWLHFVLGVAMLGLGLIVGRDRARRERIAVPTARSQGSRCHASRSAPPRSAVRRWCERGRAGERPHPAGRTSRAAPPTR